VSGLHTADLFVIAGHDMPAGMAPARSDRPWHVGHVMRSATRLYGKRFDWLRELIRSLADPAEPLPRPTPSLAGPGAMVMGLLANRDIRPHIAELLRFVGDGSLRLRLGYLPCVTRTLDADSAARHRIRSCAGSTCR
jgi:hypothetical protein